jgi:hypothetical protein
MPGGQFRRFAFARTVALLKGTGLHAIDEGDVWSFYETQAGQLICRYEWQARVVRWRNRSAAKVRDYRDAVRRIVRHWTGCGH